MAVLLPTSVVPSGERTFLNFVFTYISNDTITWWQTLGARSVSRTAQIEQKLLYGQVKLIQDVLDTTTWWQTLAARSVSRTAQIEQNLLYGQVKLIQDVLDILV